MDDMRITGPSGYNSDIFCMMLYCYKKHSLLLELKDLVGNDLMKKIMDHFAGATLKFPTERELQKIAFSITVYMRLKNLEGNKRRSVAKDLGIEYGMTRQQIEAIFKKTSAVVERHSGMEVRFGK